VAGSGAEGTSLEAAADSPADFGPVPDFRLVDQTGREFTRGDLAGHPFVAAAIFTTCAGPCPRITGAMRDLQEHLSDTDVRFVSISVDPEYDTPEVLTRYAQTWGADVDRWVFLTGEPTSVYGFVHEGLWLAAQEDPEAPRGFQVVHRTTLVAVDRQGRRRGWYEGTDPTAVGRLRERLRFLASE